MNTYLITGGEGFIGSRIVEATKGVAFDIKSGHDILDTQKLDQAAKESKGMFHCAGKISVPESIAMPDEYYRTNVVGTESVVKVAEAHASKIVFSSSAAVYGEKTEAVVEGASLNPMSPYAQNKVDGEKLLETSSVPHIALRYFNVYGPGQSPQYAGVITFFILATLKGEDLIISGDGNQVRDFVYITDIVSANSAAMEYKNTAFEIFNIGSGVETSIKTLAETIIQLTGSSSKIIYKNPRVGDIVYSQADVSKAKKVLSWEAKTSLEEGLAATISFYKANLTAMI